MKSSKVRASKHQQHEPARRFRKSQVLVKSVVKRLLLKKSLVRVKVLVCHKMQPAMHMFVNNEFDDLKAALSGLFLYPRGKVN
jgi:hypothetical protein